MRYLKEERRYSARNRFLTGQSMAVGEMLKMQRCENGAAWKMREKEKCGTLQVS